MRLSARQPDGATLREHLQAAAASGMRPDPLLLHRPPPACANVWDAFAMLHAARPVGMAPGAITPSEIVAWQQLVGVTLNPWEVETLMAMDRAAMAAMVPASAARH